MYHPIKMNQRILKMKGMVVAPHSLAVEEGAKVLRNGGNAIDAAITTAFVQGVVGVGMCGIAGFGSMNIFMADSGENKILDFHGKAGSKTTPDMWEDLFITENRGGYGFTLKGAVNDIGYQSITASGTLKTFYTAMDRYGTMKWEEVIVPAIDYAEKGYPVSGEQAILWKFRLPLFGISMIDKFKATPAAKKIFLTDGELYNVGDTLIQRDLGQTLRTIAKDGPEVFYTGKIGEKIVKDLEEHNSHITKEDWEQYEVTISDPLKTDYRGHTISSSPAPGAGITLLEIFNILEGYDLTQYDWVKLNPDAIEHLHLVAMTFKAAQADRVQYVGDPAFVNVPTDMLISKRHAAKWRDRIDAGETITIPRMAPNEEISTTHVSVIDNKGNAVSLTHSLSSISGVVTPGLGFLYNSCMNCFNPIPGHPNSIAPGKSRITGMSPTIVIDEDGDLIIVIGAPGGNKITGGVAQGIINILDHKMSPVEAVYAPRIDCQWFDTVDVSSWIPAFYAMNYRKEGIGLLGSPTTIPHSP